MEDTTIIFTDANSYVDNEQNIIMTTPMLLDKTRLDSGSLWLSNRGHALIKCPTLLSPVYQNIGSNPSRKAYR